MCWAIQNLCGNSFSNYSTYFLTQAGLDSHGAYGFALGQYGFNMVVCWTTPTRPLFTDALVMRSQLTALARGSWELGS